MLLFFCSFLYFLWPDKDTAINFYRTGEGTRFEAIVTIGMTIGIFSVFIYMPYRIITELFFSYWIENDILFIKKFGRVKEVPLNKMVYVLRKPLWTRFLGAPYVLFYYGDKRYRIPTGFYLSKEDYEYLKTKVDITEQGNFEAQF
ncbi:hypothetical protein [Idiomarina sp. HP20-50]|uniref:hypothetical protein n=1 Tax=Idiomarina sp. HP20-50 TaxID=3070813 RepID=UPI00294B43BF|nr:hypothetical protein [Idiomarina sp. HP20-50]MDV6317361.1 hypothetical protein [Idiomarina sp. HP20-50]